MVSFDQLTYTSLFGIVMLRHITEVKGHVAAQAVMLLFVNSASTYAHVMCKPVRQPHFCLHTCTPPLKFNFWLINIVGPSFS